MKHSIPIVFTILFCSIILIEIIQPAVQAYPLSFNDFEQQEIDKKCPVLHKLKNIIDRFQEYRWQQHNFPQIAGDDFVFSPKGITLKDDAFHKSDSVQYTEWWYFDVMATNGYSIQTIIQVMNLMNQRVVSTKINVYKEGNLVSSEKNLYLSDQFSASSELPLITLDGTLVMRGYIEHGHWIYDVDLQIADVALNLQFIGSIKGWKGVVPVGVWAVILPKAEVQGTITINGTPIDITGEGYHDHNWGITIQAAEKLGWFWGKIMTNTTTAVWSMIMDTAVDNNPILVINKGENEYQTINPKFIQFTADDFTLDNGRLIPHKFVLSAVTNNVSLSLVMTVLATHHVQVGTIHYWRYHIRCLGSITIGSQREIVDQIQIAELIRFR